MRDMGILRMFRGFNEFLDSGHYRVSNASSRADCLFSVAATLISVVHSRYRSEKLVTPSASASWESGASFWRPRRESNSHPQLRRLALYPLSYRGFGM